MTISYYQQIFKLKMDENQVILVDEQDNEIGFMGKLEAHQKGLLHRAFSIFIFNEKNEMLIQQRALSKYHSPGLWTNTCCSHPKPNELLLDAANRRLMEEMHMQATLDHVYQFTYRTEFENGLAEHEIDHVFIGYTNQLPTINPVEVAAYKYLSISALELDVKANPNHYTSWFKICLSNVLKTIKKRLNE